MKKEIFTKENVSKVGEVAKTILVTTAEIGVTVKILSFFGVLPNFKKDTRKDTVNASYDDAVVAITRSTLSSSEKAELIGVLQRAEASSYYQAVINIMRSTMYGPDKISAIKQMSRGFEDE